MGTTPPEDIDLVIVSEWLAERGLQAVRFSKAETRTGKTPDFRVLRGNQLAAYCEVKSPRDEWLDDRLGDAPPGVIVGGMRDDPIFNRIGSLIHKAVQQFDAVNADRTLPNILVFVNHDAMSNFGDLGEVLTGCLLTTDGQRVPTMKAISEGRIRDAKHRVDAYVWYDVKRRRVTGIFFGEEKPTHVHAICDWFGLSQSGIRR